MSTPPDFSALERAFARKHAQFARIKGMLAGLDDDLVLDVPVESLIDLTEATESPNPPAPPTPAGVRA